MIIVLVWASVCEPALGNSVSSANDDQSGPMMGSGLFGSCSMNVICVWFSRRRNRIEEESSQSLWSNAGLCGRLSHLR